MTKGAVTAADARFPLLINELPGPEAKRILALDARYVSPSYTRTYPLVARRGAGAMVEDVDGNRFLDFSAGIAVVATGHCHPRVVEAIRKQAGELIHMSGTDFYYESLARLAEKLAEIAPGDNNKKIYFGNSGTEAIEAAMKLARYHTGRDKFIAFLGAFHGRTMGALSLTASKPAQRRGFGPLVPGVYHVPYAYCYRCAYGKTPDSCAVECATVIERELFRTIVPAQEVAAIVVEPIQGEGGYVVPPPKFLRELRRIADENGIALVFDEVQCVMGRTGRMWACQHAGVEPDILAAAKGIASGLPLGVTIAKAEFMNWGPGAHASTFGGNPVSIAAAFATIELLEQELVENAARLCRRMMERLQQWPRRFPVVGDVRGMGLMQALELVKNRQTKEPAPEATTQVMERARQNGLLIGKGGLYGNVLRLAPMLNTTKADVDEAMRLLDKSFSEVKN
jgi:4-aminobutyrate aminotransferase